MADATMGGTGVSEYGYAQTRHASGARRRAGHGGRSALLVFLIVLVVILVVGDRVAARIAADRVQARLVAELSRQGVSTGSTDVRIGGVPFLTQVARGRYDEIVIDIMRARLAGLTLPHLVVVARGVRADAADLWDGTARVVADQLTGDAVVPWSTLAALADYSHLGLTGVTFSAAGDGTVRLRATAELPGGVTLPVSATAQVSVGDRLVRIRVRDVRATAGVPAALQGAVDELARRLSVEVELPALPFGLTIDRVEVHDAGVRLVATARDVPIAS